MRRTLINAASVFVGEFLIRLVNFFVPILIARVYDSSALGKYSFGLACAVLAALVPDFGLHLLTTREVASRPETLSTYFWNVQCVKLVLIVATATLVFVAAGLWVADAETRHIVWILTLRLLLQSLSQFFMAVIKAFERMHDLAMLQAVNFSLVALGLGFGFYRNWPLVALLCVFLPGVLCEVVLGGLLVSKRFGHHLGFSWPSWRQMRSISVLAFPIGLSVILITLNLRLDVIVLSWLRSASDVGLFSAANMLSTGFFLLASLIIAVVFPRMSRLASRSPEDFRDYVQVLLKFCLFFLIPVSTAIFFGADLIILLVYGHHGGAAPVLKILAFAVPMIFLNAIFFYAFVARGRNSSYLWVMATGVGTNLFVSPVLTWLFSFEGTALANLLREACLLLLFIELSLNEQSLLASAKVLIQSAGILAAHTVFGLGLLRLGLGAVQVLIVVVAVYLVVTFALKGFPKKRELLLLAG